MQVAKKKLVIDIRDTEVMQIYSATNIFLKYNWHLNSINHKTTINLRLQSIKRYWKGATQVAHKLRYIQDFFSIFIVFINKACSNYNQKIQLDKHLSFR